MNQFLKFSSLLILWVSLCGLSVSVKAPHGSPSWNFEQPKAALRLSKWDPFYVLCMPCQDKFLINQNENRENFREFGLYLQSGFFSLDLRGPKGTAVTLFGAESFNIEGGYLILEKEDDDVIRISDLEEFPANRWQESPAQEGISGAYKAYFQPAKNFKQNIASIKWDLWWSDLPSASESEP